MARLIYSTIASADGYVEDADGDIGWGAPDEELMRFINELERPVGTYLYGRRMYQTMLYWEEPDPGGPQPADGQSANGQPSGAQDFRRIWQAADKVVFSTTLASVSSTRTRIERTFSPGTVRQLKQAADRDMTVGGADLAGQALAAGLVDELRLFLMPTLVGGGKPALPTGLQRDLELLDNRTFTGGALYLSYRPR